MPSKYHDLCIVQTTIFSDVFRESENIENCRALQNSFKFKFCPLSQSQFEDSGFIHLKIVKSLSNLFNSSSVNFKTHLPEFGGKGYVVALNNYSSQNVLQWRQEIVEVVVEGPKWECQNCKQLFEEEKHAKFEKNDMNFCSMKCISSFRAKGGFNW